MKNKTEILNEIKCFIEGISLGATITSKDLSFIENSENKRTISILFNNHMKSLCDNDKYFPLFEKTKEKNINNYTRIGYEFTISKLNPIYNELMLISGMNDPNNFFNKKIYGYFHKPTYSDEAYIYYFNENDEIIKIIKTSTYENNISNDVLHRYDIESYSNFIYVRYGDDMNVVRTILFNTECYDFHRINGSLIVFNYNYLHQSANNIFIKEDTGESIDPRIIIDSLRNNSRIIERYHSNMFM